MIDPMAIAGMIFVLIILLMVGGFVVLLPVGKRLGTLLDFWIEEQRRLATGGAEPTGAQEAIDGLSERLASVEERQVFLAELMTDRSRLPPGDAEGAS